MSAAKESLSQLERPYIPCPSCLHRLINAMASGDIVTEFANNSGVKMKCAMLAMMRCSARHANHSGCCGISDSTSSRMSAVFMVPCSHAHKRKGSSFPYRHRQHGKKDRRSRN